MNDNSLILVVEDNDFVRTQIVHHLKEADYDTLEAEEGTSALEYIASDDRNSISLVIVDVRMEPMDGFEFIKIIRGRNLKTPVILVTGDQNSDLLERAGQWGVAAVLIKPVQKDRLLKTVSKTIEASKRHG